MPLSVAAACGRAGVVQLLLAAGAVVDFKDGGGRTAAYWASDYGHMEIAKLLLEKGR